LSTQKVEADFKTKGVVRMKADWTKNDPRITEALRANGRNSVPLYLLYPGTEGRKPAILPQVLTPEVVAQHIGQLP
jgi:thiol:disulfide interchange protein DsbD